MSRRSKERRKARITSGHSDSSTELALKLNDSTVKKGNAEFRDVTGDVKSNVMKGDTRVAFEKAEREGEQEFSVIKGNIEAQLAEGTDADISATTTVGEIEADDSLGLSVERRPAGRALSGKLGDGGQALRFKVTNGDIKLKK